VPFREIRAVQIRVRPGSTAGNIRLPCDFNDPPNLKFGHVHMPCSHAPISR